MKKARKLGAIFFLNSLPASRSANLRSSVSSSYDLASSFPPSIEAAINDRYDYAVDSDILPGKQKDHGNLRHYNIAAVLTDSPLRENLRFLSEVALTADYSFIRFHGGNEKGHYWYNYLYSRDELKPWVDKVTKLRE